MTTYVIVREDRSIISSFYYRTEFKQKAAAVRLANKLMAEPFQGENLVVMSRDVYNAHGYDKMTRTVRNYMTGEMVEEPINTPWSCSVASETYWNS